MRSRTTPKRHAVSVSRRRRLTGAPRSAQIAAMPTKRSQGKAKPSNAKATAKVKATVKAKPPTTKAKKPAAKPTARPAKAPKPPAKPTARPAKAPKPPAKAAGKKPAAKAAGKKPATKPTGKKPAAKATGKKPAAKAAPIAVTITLTEPLQPIDRGERYEDPLFELLEAGGLGGPGDGGGTLCSKDGEIQEADFDVEITSLAALSVIRRFLAETGAAKGSTLQYEHGGAQVEVPVGITEGLAIYLDGVSLPKEVYTPTCLEELFTQLSAALGDDLDYRGSWQGPRETALYFYGLDAEQLLAKVEPVLRAAPLAQNARVVVRHLAKQGARELRLS